MALAGDRIPAQVQVAESVQHTILVFQSRMCDDSPITVDSDGGRVQTQISFDGDRTG